MGKRVINKNASLSRINNQNFLSREKLEAAVREKAYELYVKRGCNSGNELGNWFEAEKLVKEEYKIA